MTERIFLELKNKITLIEEDGSNINPNQNDKEEINLILRDIDVALRSLEYPKKDIKNTITILKDDFK